MKTLQPEPQALRAYIRRVPLFADCSPQDVDSLAATTMLLSFERGEHVFMAGQTPECLYVLVAGSAQVHRILPDGTQKNLHLFHAVALLGEAAVFMGIPYPASCLIHEDSLVLCFSRPKLMDLMARDPGFSWRLVGQLYRKLDEFASMLAAHSQKSAVVRLASYLLGLAAPHPPAAGRSVRIELPAPKKDIANYLGIRPESLSRTFSHLEKAGAIRVDGQTVELRLETLEGFIADPEGEDA